MRDLTLVESQPTPLALSADDVAALRSLGRRLSDVADDERSVIRCVARGDEHEVTVKDAVGVVALPGVRLVVQPKIPAPHFFHLLDRARVAPRLADVPVALASAAALPELVAGWFVAALERLLRRGLLADYQDRTGELPAVRGTIRPLETAALFYRGRVAFVCDYDEFTTDAPLNRVLAAAAATVARTPFLSPDVRRRARRSLSRMDDIGPLRPDDLRTSLDRRTAHYGEAFPLALHVLRATGRDVAIGVEPGRVFLVRTPTLVEHAVRAVLREGMADLVAVGSERRSLPGSSRGLHPDLVFGEQAVGDVKYKLVSGEWQRPDLYEVVAFAAGYRVEAAALVGFAASRAASADVRFGDIAVRTLLWDVDLSPAAAAAALVDEARTWWDESAGIAGRAAWFTTA